jgi:LPXTG-motif cell wall-anchored protein
MTAGTISDNYAGEDGGGVEISMGHTGTTSTYAEKEITVNFSDCEIINNHANGNGGGFNMSENPGQAVYLTINTGTTITGNTAEGNGGGVYLEYGTFTLNGGTIGGSSETEANSATGNGGGVYVTVGTANIAGGTITGNTAASGGGVYVNSGAANISGGIVSSNTAGQDGGGVYVGGGDVTMSGGYVQNNTAAANGGGIAVVGTSTALQTVTATSESGGITVSGNASTAGNGGGIYVNYGKFTLQEATIINNTANDPDTLNSLEHGNGGGVYVKNGALKMTDGSVSGNSCSRFGGGLYVYENDGTMTSSATIGDESVSFVFDGGQIQNNSAGQCGGGVAEYRSSMTIRGDGVSISGNTAVNGGGVYARWNSSTADEILTLSDGSISGNTAVALSEESIGLYQTIWSKSGLDGNGTNQTSLTFQSTDNVSSYNPDRGGNGGGVFAQNAKVLVSGADIENNTAARNGGGVYALHNEETITTITVSYEWTTTSNSSEVSGLNEWRKPQSLQNYSGDDKTQYYVRNNSGYGPDSSTTYSYYKRVETQSTEQSTDVLTLELTDGNILNNTAGAHGGGVSMYAFDCSVTDHSHTLATISGTNIRISYNTALNGGAFYVAGGKLTVEGGIIMGNAAKLPDGVTAESLYADGVTTAFDTDSNQGVGGGLYVYRTGELVLDVEAVEGKNLGVFSNTADFAANDVYCGPLSTSKISLPAVDNMDLTLYGHKIGTAIAWYEDFPDGDTLYSLNNTTVTDTSETAVANYRNYNSTVKRYIEPTNGETVSTNKVFAVSDDSETVNGYMCLTLGYELTRVNLTVLKEMTEGYTSNQVFEFTATITGAPSSNDDETFLIFTPENSQTGDVTLTETELAALERYTVTNEGSDGEAATLTFQLKANESVVLYGIPIDATVTIQEVDTKESADAAAATDVTQRYEVSYTGRQVELEANANQCTVQLAKTNGFVTCTNVTKSYQLPKTGGSGTQRYVWCGLALMVLAAGGTLGGKRRKRRARKGADAQ